MRVVAWLDRHWRVLLVLLMAWMAVLLVIQARGKYIWHDEIYTILGSRLGILSLWRASLDGMDLSPPLNTVFTRFVHGIAGEGHMTTRIPPMAGFLTAVAVVFVLVRRRTSVIVALGSAFFLCSTPAWRYAIEARGYGLALGLFALAIYGWSEAARGRQPVKHLALMAAALAAGVWTHYYFVFAFVPIAAAELTRQLVTRRFDAAPWTAFTLAGALTMPLASLARVAGAQRSTFWARSDMIGVGDLYSFFFGGVAPYRLVFAAIGGVAMLEIVRRSRTRRWPRRLSAPDLVLCLMCLAVPAIAVLLGSFTQVFTDRYVVFGAAGLALALPLLVWSVLPPEGIGDWLAASVLAASFVALSAQVIEGRRPPPNQLRDRPFLVDLLKGSLPVAMTGGVAYLEMWWYASDEMRPHAIYLADPAGQRRDTMTDTVDRNYLALGRWSPVPIVRITDFMKTHKHFWLYSFGNNWAERSLRLAGATLREWGRESPAAGILYEVYLPDKPRSSRRARGAPAGAERGTGVPAPRPGSGRPEPTSKGASDGVGGPGRLRAEGASASLAEAQRRRAGRSPPV